MTGIFSLFEDWEGIRIVLIIILIGIFLVFMFLLGSGWSLW